MHLNLKMFLFKSNIYICIYRVLHLNINTEVGTNITFYFCCHFDDLSYQTWSIPADEITVQPSHTFLQDVAVTLDTQDNTFISCFPSVTVK